MDEGEVWSSIRSRLTSCRDDMRQAVEAQKYEEESAWLDQLARKLAAAVVQRVGRNDALPRR